MKLFIRCLSILLACLLLVPAVLSSCGQTSSGDGDGSETEQSGNESETPGGLEDYVEIDLTGYKLMRSDYSPKDVTTAFSKLLRVIREMTDLSLGVGTDYVDDTINNRAEYEIIVGATEIEEAQPFQDELKEGEYVIACEGTKIFIIGYDVSETVYAVDRFLKIAFDYDTDKYTNDKWGKTVVRIPKKEVSEMAGKTLESGRVIRPIVQVSSDPLLPISDFKPGGKYDLTEDSIDFHMTSGCGYRGTTGEGPYRIEFTVENRNNKANPIVQLMVNQASGVEHICMSIEHGTFVRVGRSTYERGGASVKLKDPNNYTFRLEVHPEAQRAFYYIDGVFLGEMNVGNDETPLVENAPFSICAVGDDLDVSVYDIYLEQIEETVDYRRYDAVPGEVTDEGVYPKSENAPAQTIYVLNAVDLTGRELMTAVTLQGLVNRTTPEIFLDYRAYNDDMRYSFVQEEAAYLTMLEQKGRTLVQAKLTDLLVQFKDRYKGVIIGDCMKTNFGENLATSLAGVLDAVYLTPGQYDSLKDQIQKDILFRLDDRFKTSVDAYMWLWNTYGDQFSKDVLFHAPASAECAGHTARVCRDYAVMSRALFFCTTDVQTYDDYDFYMSLFASTKPNTGIIGRGGGCFPEFEMFTICGQFGKYFTYGFSTPNMSLLNSLEVGELKQKADVSGATLQDDTIYVTFDLSEGDNLSWDYHLWMFNFRDVEARAAIAKGYSFCGAIYYVAPAVLEYLYSQATPNDYFYMDGGGISNLGSPDAFGLLYKDEDRAKIVTRMLELTNYVAGKTDTVVLRALHNISDEMGNRMAAECPNLQGLFSSYGNVTPAIGGTSQYADSVYLLNSDVVRCRSFLTTFAGSLTPQLQKLLSQTAARQADRGIIFAKVFVYCNQMLNDVSVMQTFRQELQDATGKKVVIVRPDTFVELYQEYAG